MRVIIHITRNTPAMLYYAVSAVLFAFYLLMVYSIRSLFGLIPAGLYGLFLILTWADRWAGWKSAQPGQLGRPDQQKIGNKKPAPDLH